MIVADTSAVLALLDRRDRNHATVKALFRKNQDDWVLPWAILPEVDYLVTKTATPAAARGFLADIAVGAYHVEWGRDEDCHRANELNRQYADLELGLVDAIVMAIAERLEARAIATFDRRHFLAVRLRGQPELLPTIR